jgi:hypothetical protein
LDGSCTNTPNNPLCDDDLFCTDDDFCDPAHADAHVTTGCVNETDPCVPKICNEADDTCDDCVANADCDDGILCTADTCDGVTGNCKNNADHDSCPDPYFCDGDDVCDPADPDADSNGCVHPGNPCGGVTPICDETDDVCEACVSNAECDDGIDCTDDTCNGATGACSNLDNCTLPEVCNMTTGQCEIP